MRSFTMRGNSAHISLESRSSFTRWRVYSVHPFVIANVEGSDALTKELQAFTREKLAQHEFPRIVEYVSELPKTPAGKVNRKVLREQEASKASAN